MLILGGIFDLEGEGPSLEPGAGFREKGEDLNADVELEAEVEVKFGAGL